MPDKAKDDDTALPLQEWLALLTAHGVPMRLGMQLAAKAYKDFNTRTKLTTLKGDKLAAFLPDKEQNKLVTNAVRNITAGKATSKKWAKDNDLLNPLAPAEAAVPANFDFNEILDPEQLLPVSVTVNRAPIKTAWAYTVARRRGFDVQESLSLAHVYVHIGSLKHALALGNILSPEKTRDAEEEIRELPGEADYRKPYTSPHKRKRFEDKAVGSSQPWVGLLRSKLPVIEREDGTWRALQKGVPVEPSLAYLYITRALKDHTGHVMGAMKLVVDSYTSDEIDVVGLNLYNEFKPDVQGWGQRGSVEVSKILEQMKDPVKDGEEQEAESAQPAEDDQPRTPEPQSHLANAEVKKAGTDHIEPSAKKRKETTVEDEFDDDGTWDNVDFSGIP